MSATQRADLFVGATPVRDLLRACDWRGTPLGDPADWPQSLRAVVRVMLTSRFAIWMAWGPELTFLCNDAYLPTVGIKRDWVIGNRSDKVWAEIWPDIGPRIDRVLTTGEATWDEALPLYLERSGFSEETYHTFSYSPLADDDGVIRGMLCVVAEVTEKVIGERQLDFLRDLGTRLAAAASRADVMRSLEDSLAADPRDLPFALAYLVDKTGDSASLAARHGLPPDNGVAPAFLSLEAEQGPWPLTRARAGVTQPVDALPDVVAGLRLDHWQRPPSRALIAPLRRNEAAAPVGYLVAGLNPHRALDASYIGFVELVTAQVAAAIARADEFERERERAKALTEIDRAKTTFFSNISHEFRTPLTLMLGPLEDALSEGAALGAAQRERLQAAHRNGMRLLRLVNALLEFSRIEAGRVEVKFQPTDLAGLTADLASSFGSATDRAGLTLVVDTPELPEPVYVDPDMWEKIVLNLVSNAFKFTFEGEIAVRLRAEGDRAVLTVSDTGAGIPAHEIPKLFDRFHRVEGAKGRSYEGSGIGLALVQELARLHGGDVAVSSTLGRGSTFTVSLPVGRAHIPDASIVAAGPTAKVSGSASFFVEEALLWLPEADVSGAPAAARDGPRVLLADDNADLRAYIARLLGDRGYAVETAPDGEAALAAARRDKPALLLTDVMMPRLDGFGLLREVRADPALRDLPVIMLSARAGEEAKIEGFDAGADDYLVKPFSARELLARVAANVAMARVRREAMEAVHASQAEAQAQAERVEMALDAGALVGVWVWNLREDKFVADDRFARAFGLDSERLKTGLRGADVRARIHEGDKARVVEAFAEAMRGDGRYRCEYRVRQGDDSYRWIEANGRLDLDGDGEPLRFPGVLIDIDHRRRMEDELRRLNEDLETRVAQAIEKREEAESALRQSQKMEAVGQLTGGIAHDFNNLLTIINGNVESAQRALAAGNSSRAQTAMENAQKGAARAAALTQRLLAFARRQPLTPRAVRLDHLVAGMSDLLTRALGETVSLDVNVAADLPWIKVDPNQLENAILNLAVNARDAMPSGGKLTISAAPARLPAEGAESGPEAAWGEYVGLAVNDTGEGMSRDVLARAFDPFFTTKEVGKGTGLGLSMVYGFVKQSDGLVKLESEPGAGVTVRLFFPALAGPVEPEAAPSEIRLDGVNTDKRILVVEDDDDVREFTAGVARELGFRVAEAHDGAAALRILQNAAQRVDMLITDVVMPGMSGPELVERARLVRPKLKVLYSSGYTPETIAGAEQLASGSALIAKPFTYRGLYEKIAAILGE